MNGRLLAVAWCCCLTLGAIASRGQAATPGEELLAVAGQQNGLVVVLGLPADNPQLVQQLADNGQWMIYFQSDEADQVRQVREAAESAGLLGRRVFADVGPFKLAQSAANKAILGGETQPTVTQDR